MGVSIRCLSSTEELAVHGWIAEKMVDGSGTKNTAHLDEALVAATSAHQQRNAEDEVDDHLGQSALAVAVELAEGAGLLVEEEEIADALVRMLDGGRQTFASVVRGTHDSRLHWVHSPGGPW